MTRFISVLIAFVLSVAPLAAQTTTWKSDKAHSRVNFSVTHMVISEVTGRFTDFEATLENSTDDFINAKITATIKTASINTDNEGRDNHLRSDDFFNAETYPEITFTSTEIEKTGKDTYKIKGNLTIRDVTKPVVLDTKYNGQITDSRGNTRAGFKATTVIDRFEFGTKWNRALETGGLIASKDVEITLLFEFNKQTEKAK